MKTLFLGGIKSGKSKNAESYTLALSKKKPYYLATTEFFDEEMQEKVNLHKLQRKENFYTIEEALALTKTITQLNNEFVLVECISMWLNNMLYHKYTHQQILQEIDILCKLPNNLVFVLNDVSCSVVSDNSLVREFVNLSGIISQKLAKSCDEVYHVTAGISVKIK